MSALLAVELRRILARRLTRLLAVLQLVAIVIAAVVVYLTSGEGSSQFELVNLTEIFKGTSVALGFTAWLIGASLIGADWQTETMRTTLTWEPRRGHVLFAKTLACAAMSAVGALALLALLGIALLPAASRGTTAGADAAWLSSLIWTSLRISALAALAATASIAIATIGRRTSAALAVGFAYLLIIEGVIRGSFTSLQRWLIGDNAAVLVEGHSFAGVGDRSPLEAGLFLSACAAALLVAALAWFRWRDVQ